MYLIIDTATLYFLDTLTFIAVPEPLLIPSPLAPTKHTPFARLNSDCRHKEAEATQLASRTIQLPFFAAIQWSRSCWDTAFAHAYESHGGMTSAMSHSPQIMQHRLATTPLCTEKALNKGLCTVHLLCGRNISDCMFLLL